MIFFLLCCVKIIILKVYYVFREKQCELKSMVVTFAIAINFTKLVYLTSHSYYSQLIVCLAYSLSVCQFNNNANFIIVCLHSVPIILLLCLSYMYFQGCRGPF